MSVRRLVVGAVIVDDLDRPMRILAARRVGKYAGRWEFPGGKVEDGERPEAALVREVNEELAALIDVHVSVNRSWPISAELELRLYVCTLGHGIPRPGMDHDLVEWVAEDALESLEWLPADRAALFEVRRIVGWDESQTSVM